MACELCQPSFEPCAHEDLAAGVAEAAKPFEHARGGSKGVEYYGRIGFTVCGGDVVVDMVANDGSSVIQATLTAREWGQIVHTIGKGTKPSHYDAPRVWCPLCLVGGRSMHQRP